MSNAVFPSLPGLSWNVTRAPEFATREQIAGSLREVRQSLTAYPIWTFGMSYEVLRQTGSLNELRTLAGFFLQRRGKFDSFLYTNPEDNSVTDEQFGTGDGAATAFQLTRAYGGFVEPCENINAITNIKKAGTPTSAYTLGSTGIVTFTTAPVLGAALTWSGTYYMRCRFVEDVNEFNEFMHNLFELQKLELRGAPGNKVGS